MKFTLYCLSRIRSPQQFLLCPYWKLQLNQPLSCIDWEDFSSASASKHLPVHMQLTGSSWGENWHCPCCQPSPPSCRRRLWGGRAARTSRIHWQKLCYVKLSHSSFTFRFYFFCAFSPRATAQPPKIKLRMRETDTLLAPVSSKGKG